MKMCSVFRALWLGAVCGLAALGSGCAPLLAPVHVEIPLDLSKVGNTAEAEFRTWVEDRYLLQMKIFSPTGNAWEDTVLDSYLGGFDARKPGTNIPFHITVTKGRGKKEKVEYDQDVSTSGINGANRRAFYRTVDIIRLRPGRHRIRITNLTDHKPLQGVSVILHIYYFRAK